MRTDSLLGRSCSALLLALLVAAPLAAQDVPAWADEIRAIRVPDGRLPDYASRPPAPVDWPPPPLTTAPVPVRALYVNAWAFGTKKFYELVKMIEGTEVNSLVIDVKDDTGYLTYHSDVPTAIQIGANKELRAPETRERLRTLIAHGIHPIGRIVVAKDPLLANHKQEWAILQTGGGVWHDRQGRAWVDAFNDSVWIYAGQLGAEAVKMGFAELQFDYVRFPDEPKGRMANAVFPSRRGKETSEEGVTRNIRMLRERIKALGVPFTIDVFGLTTSAEDDMGIGQKWESLVTSADAVLPMVYPSHYGKGSYGFDHPNAEPYAIIHRAMTDALKRSAPFKNSAEIRPYFQAFTLGKPKYTPMHVREQMRAAEELGIHGWVLWNARSVYERAYLRDASGKTAARRTDGQADRADTTERAVRRTGGQGDTTVKADSAIKPDSAVKPDSLIKPDSIVKPDSAPHDSQP